jgi:hypothetical protein
METNLVWQDRLLPESPAFVPCALWLGAFLDSMVFFRGFLSILTFVIVIVSFGVSPSTSTAAIASRRPVRARPSRERGALLPRAAQVPTDEE